MAPLVGAPRLPSSFGLSTGGVGVPSQAATRLGCPPRTVMAVGHAFAQSTAGAVARTGNIRVASFDEAQRVRAAILAEGAPELQPFFPA
jgi:hypothetical protein